MRLQYLPNSLSHSVSTRSSDSLKPDDGLRSNLFKFIHQIISVKVVLVVIQERICGSEGGTLRYHFTNSGCILESSIQHSGLSRIIL